MKNIFLSVCATAILLCLSCSTWGARDWEEIPDRQFHFNRFTFVDKMYENDEAFVFISSLPFRDILDSLEKTYAIKIDSSHFDEFITAKKKDELKESGFIYRDTYTWQSGYTAGNRIEFSYITHMSSEGDFIKTYTLDLISNGKIRKRFQDDIDRDNELIPHLLRSIRRVKIIDPRTPLPEQTEKKADPEKTDRLDKLLNTLTPREREALKKKLENKPE
ncbi:MAG: hypothetical protein CVV44_18600 [Spirochaetae bacterium HGW-Spirochaetae-1]|nr:MAG: hypothetical protein CVV44_18600 [Spirochaetae bacterium HGW-Spirochaetae-1]